MHNNDITKIKTQKVAVTEDTEVNNPVYRMEKQATRGAYALILPYTDFNHRVDLKLQEKKQYRHSGDKYEQIIKALSHELLLPDFRVRARLIQLGHIFAKGAVNYVDHNRIEPFSFNEESLPEEKYTFVIDRTSAGILYNNSESFKKILSTGKFIYADGHIIRNEPKYVVRMGSTLHLTAWASAHVDQCCLRFEQIFIQKNVGQYVFGRMYYDADYVKQTTFYMEDLINSKELDELEARERYISEFPKTFEDAFDQLMRKNGYSRETMAEEMQMDARTLDRWLSDPDKKISADFVMMITLIWKLPDWISDLLFKRAHIQLDEDDKRHMAFRYIQRVLWMDGVDKVNEYLKSRKLETLTL